MQGRCVCPAAAIRAGIEVESDFEHLAVLYAAGRHITLAPPNYAMVGQALLGADLRATPLLSRDDSGGRSTENPGSSADSCSNCRKAATPLARGAPDAKPYCQCRLHNDVRPSRNEHRDSRCAALQRTAQRRCHDRLCIGIRCDCQWTDMTPGGDVGITDGSAGVLDPDRAPAKPPSRNW